jgi:hypothetical protein
MAPNRSSSLLYCAKEPKVKFEKGNENGSLLHRRARGKTSQSSTKRGLSATPRGSVNHSMKFLFIYLLCLQQTLYFFVLYIPIVYHNFPYVKRNHEKTTIYIYILHLESVVAYQKLESEKGGFGERE